MPSSNRGNRPKSAGALEDKDKPQIEHAPVEPPQYIDPGEPWDPESAEALTRLYESGEGYLHRRPEDHRARRRPPQQATPDVQATGEPGRDRVWLDARLAEIAARLQDSLADINPDKALAHLNGRLDAIERSFNEALNGVVQRSDLDGLKLIEAHVMELADHVAQTRGRLDRIDAIDEKVQDLTRKLEEGDHQRLTALEKLLHDYIAEWRRGEERTAGALQKLEDAVARVGENMEVVEAQKPAPDLSLSLLGAPGLKEQEVESDPISHVYADAARALQQSALRSALDAADYTPQVQHGEASANMPLHALSELPADQSAARPPLLESLTPPLLRELAARLRRAYVSGTQPARGEPQSSDPERPAEKTRAAGGFSKRWPNFLLAGAVTLFAAIGYLLVDVFMTTSAAPRRPAAAEVSGRPGVAGAVQAEYSPRPRDRSTNPEQEAVIAPTDLGRIDAIGHAIAAVFRREEGGRPTVESTASIDPDGFRRGTDPAHVGWATLPLTIGPASLRQAALRGDAAAQAEVASRFLAGHGVERDLHQAFHWYGRAAAQGLAPAQYRYAALYERGLGTTRDPERARVWYARAAEQGNIKAMHNLAVLSVAGGRSDYATAAKWFARAADLGFVDSQVNLAILYQAGRGVPKDPTLAYKWLAIAGRAGDREAMGRVSEAKARLGPAELEVAETMIAAWRAGTPDAAANEASTAALDGER